MYAEGLDGTFCADCERSVLTHRAVQDWDVILGAQVVYCEECYPKLISVGLCLN
jgi:hypothetical protein